MKQALRPFCVKFLTMCTIVPVVTVSSCSWFILTALRSVKHVDNYISTQGIIDSTGAETFAKEPS